MIPVPTQYKVILSTSTAIVGQSNDALNPRTFAVIGSKMIECSHCMLVGYFKSIPLKVLNANIQPKQTPG